MNPKNLIRHAVRLVLGVLFLGASATYFLDLIPPPAEAMADDVQAFTHGLSAARYMFPLIKGTELVAALLLLGNRFVPLALLLLAPVVVNIVAFHVFLAPAGLLVAVVALVLLATLAFLHRDAYRTMLKAVA